MTDTLIDGLYREGEPIADTRAPNVPIEERWERRRFEAVLRTVPATSANQSSAPPVRISK